MQARSITDSTNAMIDPYLGLEGRALGAQRASVKSKPQVPEAKCGTPITIWIKLFTRPIAIPTSVEERA
jgi:hypothetical protein